MANKSKIGLISTKKALKEITRLIALGMPEHAVATKFGISDSSFRKYREENPDIKEAIRKGHAKVIADVVGSLVKRATGYSKVEKTKKYKYVDGKKVLVGEIEVTKHYPASDKAIAYYLNNKASDTWSNRDKADKVEVNITNTPLTEEARKQALKRLEEEEEALLKAKPTQMV